MKREYCVDNLRAIAILLVVLGHSIIIYDSGWGIATSEIECLPFYYLKKIINVIQMPLFFSISGFCFCLSQNKSLNRKMILNKVKRLIIPYFTIAFLYMDPIKILLDVPGYKFSINLLMQQFILFQNNGHLWYLPTLFLMFVFSAKHKYGGGVKGLFLLSFIFYLVSNNIPNYFSIKQFCQYYVFFMLGYFCCIYKNKILRKSSVGYILCAMSIIASLCLQEGELGMRIIMLLVSLMFCVGCYTIININKNSILLKLSEKSYGVYLFHSPLVYFMYMLYPNANPILMLFVNFVVCGLVSIGLLEMIKRVGLSFIIGYINRQK